jgi:hypothetical protein
LVFLGFPWILSIESRLINHLHGIFAEKFSHAFSLAFDGREQPSTASKRRSAMNRSWTKFSMSSDYPQVIFIDSRQAEACESGPIPPREADQGRAAVLFGLDFARGPSIRSRAGARQGSVPRRWNKFRQHAVYRPSTFAHVRRAGGQYGPWNFALASRSSDPDHYPNSAALSLALSPLSSSVKSIAAAAGRGAYIERGE